MKTIFDLQKKPPPAPRNAPTSTMPPQDIEVPTGTLRYRANSHKASAVDIEVTLVAAVWGPETQRALRELLYFEIAGGDSDVQGILAGTSEAKATDRWTLSLPDEEETIYTSLPHKGLRVVDTRIKIPELRRIIHHAAAIDASGRVVVVDRMEDIWDKVFNTTTTPLRHEWKQAMIPAIEESGVAVLCESFALPKGFSAYLIHEDATKIMDEIACSHVKRHGLSEITRGKEE